MQQPQQALYSAVDSRSLELILFPTEQCNFRCVYCYEDFQLGRMSQAVVSGIKELIRHRISTLQVLIISWFGGEPLLGLGVIEEVSEHILSLIRQHPHVCYTAGMTTNAYLLSLATASRLVSLGINSFQISLDGDKALHDTTRRRADGGESFERIWDNLLAIRDSNLVLDVLLRVHLTTANLSSVEELLRKISGAFGGDQRFHVYLKPIGRGGGPNDELLPVLPSGQAKDVMAQLGRLLDGVCLVNEEMNAEHPICYASKANSFAIRSDGSVAKCTVALSDPRNRVGHLSEDGKIIFDRDKLNLWMRGLETGDPMDLACPYQKMDSNSHSSMAESASISLSPR
jgi:uncharacterized protein